ncbi:MAG TPA: acyl carrier protein [Thermodesulfobacteriota bacterium]|nr:acyl carrier protein [Deltaproteobacteria bacterium]HNU70196.1 acyl carrier protein [Thermodesulfobacteriota bacterium]HQO78300.1 acyl carrier protein [Thermodesulfobacteriota bacterium]
MSEYTKERIIQDLVDILEDMTSDWDLEFDAAIGPQTRLMADLEFESIDVVQYVTAIEERFGQRGLPFEELLMIDGRYVDEVAVGDTAEFLYRHLNG